MALSRTTGVKLIYFELFLIILFGGGLIFFLFLRMSTATCSDGIQNQGETGIDCGGPCASCEIVNLPPLQFSDIKVFSNKDKIDLLLTLENPSKDYGVKSFHYQVIEDRDNSVLVEGDDFLLPGQRKYIPIFQVVTPSFFSSALHGEISASTTDWIKPKTTAQPVSQDVSLKFRNGKYSIEGKISNLLVLPVKVRALGLLLDSKGQVITFTQSNIDLSANESRDIGLVFPQVPPGSYTFKLIPEVNLFSL